MIVSNARLINCNSDFHIRSARTFRHEDSSMSAGYTIVVIDWTDPDVEWTETREQILADEFSFYSFSSGLYSQQVGFTWYGDIVVVKIWFSFDI